MIARNLHGGDESFNRSLQACEVKYTTFTDVELQARSFAGWNLVYTQISSGTFEGSSSAVSLAAIRLWAERLNRVVHQRGTAPSDKLTIAVPLELEGHARMCGERSELNSLHVFSSLPEFEFYSPDRHVLIVIEIDADSLSTDSSRALVNSIRARCRSPIVPMAGEEANNLRELLRDVLWSSTQSTESHGGGIAGRLDLLERKILYAISEVLNVPSEQPNRLTAKSASNWALVNAVQELLQDSKTCPLSIAGLCVELKLSRRTIQYAFQDALDLNPISYLRAVRLNHARRDLRNGQSVTSAATKWGFWHLSGFAHDYRVMFGELPSRTSKRTGTESV